MTEPGASAPARREAGKPHGLILAGGGAARLGGVDKPLLQLGGRTILDHIVERLGPQCDEIVLSLNGDLGRVTEFGGPIVADHPEDRGAGPLAGLLAGLDWVALHRPAAGLVLSIPGDVPFGPSDLAVRLSTARHQAKAVAACARSGDRAHPLIGLWPVEIRHDLRAALRGQGLRRAMDFVARHAVAWADWPATPHDPFLNVNTPDDLREANRLAESLG